MLLPFTFAWAPAERTIPQSLPVTVVPVPLVLWRFTPGEIAVIADLHRMSPQTFTKNYVVAREKNTAVGIFQATYLPTDPARMPDDGRLRELKPDLSWLTVAGQHVMPKPGVWKYPPLPVNLIYS
mgnify:CR=1 FL=1